MIYAILSDIHANELALSAALSDARRQGAERFICLGDVVGYGPEPERAVAIIRQTAAVTLAGNHDAAVAGRLDPSDFIGRAAAAVSRHREALTGESLEWLSRLPCMFKGGTFICAHGDFTMPEAFNYISDETEAAANFAARREQLMFVGHTHVPGLFLTGASGKVYRLAPADFTLEDGKRYIVNPGSIGYPRTEGNTCESTYVLYDDAERTITFRRLPFTVRSVMQTGRNPRHLKPWHLAAIILAAAGAVGAAAWYLAPAERVETITEEVAIGHIDKTGECAVSPTDRKLCVQVKLAKGSPPAQLQLVLRDAAGKTLWEERWTAKKSRKATVRTPPGTARATLSAGRTAGDVAASFSEFSLTPLP